jgi:transcriptional regulator with XRE-family HTH domain
MRSRRKAPDGIIQLKDLLFHSGALGDYLRDERRRHGLSLRSLEEQTGVSDSEIHHLETGNQECRLSSFIRICSALGVPPGLALDDVLISSYSFFEPKIENDRLFEELCRERWKRKPDQLNALSGQLARYCCTAAHLLRCADPVRRARSFRYPTEALHSAFTKFANFVSEMRSSLERANVLRALQQQPVAELEALGVLELSFLDDLAVTEHRDLWWPAFDSADRYYKLDDIVAKPYLAVVIGPQTWSELRSRLLLVTRGSGTRAALAREFGVSTAAVSQWLSGASAPTADNTVRLLQFVESAEAKQKQSAGSVSETRPAQKRSKPRRSNYEKTNKPSSDRKKR